MNDEEEYRKSDDALTLAELRERERVEMGGEDG